MMSRQQVSIPLGDGIQSSQVNSQAAQQQQLQQLSMMRSVRTAQCKDHPEEKYTNFCCESNCMKPLCPDCIEKHTHYHQQNGSYPDIQSIKSVRNKCKLRLNEFKDKIDQLCDQIDFAEQSAHLDESDEGIEKIMSAKRKILEIVNTYFIALVDKYKQRLIVLSEKELKTKTVQDRLSNFLGDIESLSNKLDTPLYQIDTLNEVQGLEWNPELDDLERQILEIQNAHKMFSIDVIVEENKIRMLRTDLLQYARLGACILPGQQMLETSTGGQFQDQQYQKDQFAMLQQQQQQQQEQLIQYQQQRQQKLQPQVIDSKKAIIDQKFTTPSLKQGTKGKYAANLEDKNSAGQSSQSIAKALVGQNGDSSGQQLRFKGGSDEEKQSFPSHDDSSIQEERKQIQDQLVHFDAGIEDSSIAQLQLSQQSYFENSCPHKVLPYYSTATKTLYTTDTNTTSTIQQYSVPDASIGEFHRLLIVPRGDIYIMGGIIKTTETNKVFKFEYSSSKFIDRPPMIFPRSSFAAVFLSIDKGAIFVIGGKRDGMPSADCERYDIATNKWKSIANLNYAAYAASACAFNSTSIFKFGGIGPGKQQNNNYIEKYDATLNTWEVIKLKHEDMNGVHDLDQKFLLFFNLGCIQINESSMYIFGGQYQKRPSRQSYCLDVRKNNQKNGQDNGTQVIYVLNSFDLVALPFEGTFSSNPIVHNDKIMAYQNIPEGDSNPQIQQQKRLVTFDGTKWTSELKTLS